MPLIAVESKVSMKDTTATAAEIRQWARSNDVEVSTRGRVHPDERFNGGGARGIGFFADVHHTRASGGVNMGELFFGRRSSRLGFFTGIYR